MTNPPLTPEERLSRLEGVYEHLATKADITRLEGQITWLKADTTRLEGEVKAAMTELKTELHKVLNHNLYITIGAVVAVAVLVKYLP